MRPPTLGAILVLLLVALGGPKMFALQATPEPQVVPRDDATPVSLTGIAFAPVADFHGASLGE